MKLSGLRSNRSHEGSIWAVKWIPETDSRDALIMTGSHDQFVATWTSDVLCITELSKTHGAGVCAVAVHPSGLIAASATLETVVRVFEVDTLDVIATFQAPRAWKMEFNPTGTFLATTCTGYQGSIKLWDTATWQLIATIPVPDPLTTPYNIYGKGVISVAWSPDGKRIACGSRDGTISVFDLTREKFLHHLEGHSKSVRSLVYSPTDPTILFSASDDEPSFVHMYDAEGKSLIEAMSGHTSRVLSVDVSPDGSALATGSSDDTVRLWDLSMRATVQTMSDHTDQVWGVAFCPPGRRSARGGQLVSASDDESISLYDYSCSC